MDLVEQQQPRFLRILLLHPIVQVITRVYILFFFFNDPATTEFYTSIDTLSLHDALPISFDENGLKKLSCLQYRHGPNHGHHLHRDRKSTRLNSSHQSTSRMPSSA